MRVGRSVTVCGFYFSAPHPLPKLPPLLRPETRTTSELNYMFGQYVTRHNPAPCALGSTPEQALAPDFHPLLLVLHSSGTKSAELPIVSRARAVQRRLSALSKVYGAFIRTMASPRKSPAVIQQQRFKATCTCQASRRPGSPRCNPTHVMYAPLPPLAYLVYRAPLPVVRDGHAFTDARLRHTGEIGAAHCACGTVHGSRLIVLSE